MTKPKFKIPHTFTIVFSIIVVCAVLTWIIPGGEFERQTVMVDGHARNVVVGDSYHHVQNQPQTWQVFTAFFKGFERTSNIIVFILMIGGAFWIMNETNAINKGIYLFLDRTQKMQKHKFFRAVGVNNLLIIAIMLMFSLFGSVFGMSEETIAFIVIFVPLAISMGYDSIVGVLMCYVAAHVGFAGAMLNPFTIGIAQGLSGLPTFSGIGYRLFCWILLTVVAIVFTLIYANWVKKHPERSVMYELDQYWRDKTGEVSTDQSLAKSTIATWVVYGIIAAVLLFCAIAIPKTDITVGLGSHRMVVFPIVAGCYILLGFFAVRKSVHHYILVLLLLTIVSLVTGVLGYGWYVMEIAGLFFAMGIAAGFAYNLKFDRIVRLFLEGCKDIMVAALVVGLAGGIIVILEDGKIIDTILYAISQGLGDSGRIGTTGVMYVVQNMLNLIIPSGSAKAALTIPMMAEWSDLMGVSRQLTVLAFQFGDGFTNMITPTSGVLIGVLGVARIPYAKWFKFIWKFLLALIILGFFLLLPPLFMPFAGF
ncbi:MAG: YfcC family protein [Bacteroidales bacterium]|nr:YfcC family protein [Bacteroidales bacterium]MBR6161125.1 YfcC family protein [Bacteroidales bacterium]